LIEIFGPFYDPNIVGKWDTHEIDVVGKRHFGKEASIMCTGVDAAVTSKHFNAGIYDDLAVEDNSRTPAMREKIKTWYYKTWTPLILPPDSNIPHSGEQHGLGTRQHPEDQYSHLSSNELKDKVLEIPALDSQGNSPWPEMYPPKFFKQKRRRMGIILFNAQYQQNTEAMRGEVFQYDNCIQLPDEEWPALEKLRVYMGVDLAVGEKDRDCMFAISVIGIMGSVSKRDYYSYLLDYYLEHLRASEQEAKVIEFYDKWKPLRTGLEANAYQDILRQTLKKSRPSMVVRKITTKVDKLTRAQKLSWLFEAKRAFFHDNGRHARPIDHLVRFPSDKFTKDFFDSYDNAHVAAKKKGKRRNQRKQFGVL
jgi:phage terminase large subunit-like protein